MSSPLEDYWEYFRSEIEASIDRLLFIILLQDLYYEYGFGIENIGLETLRIFRIDCIWRSEFVNLNSSTPNFGVRLKISPDF